MAEDVRTEPSSGEPNELPEPETPSEATSTSRWRNPTIAWGVAAVAIAAALIMAVMWRQAESDASDLRKAERERVEEQHARPDLAEIAEDTFSDEFSWDGDEDTVTVSIFGFGMDELSDYLDELGFSSAVVERMGRTRALDGTLEAEGDNVNASWTYHPDDGLQVVFEVQ